MVKVQMTISTGNALLNQCFNVNAFIILQEPWWSAESQKGRMLPNYVGSSPKDFYLKSNHSYCKNKNGEKACHGSVSAMWYITNTCFGLNRSYSNNKEKKAFPVLNFMRWLLSAFDCLFSIIRSWQPKWTKHHATRKFWNISSWHVWDWWPSLP